ncbi:GDSL-type esterase/lipase family protein [Fontibacter flavus]|uniref:GDSL-type esterase/lipase family protein n=1 Tax=Fontibacter flavus TaxID=654838 RepID=A0ABV6FRU8_9BACT
MKKLPFILLFLFGVLTSFAQSTIKVACVGNSITQGPGREHPDSFPLQMQVLLGDQYLVKNFGVSGRTLLKKGDFPYWNEPQFEEVKKFSPDILVIKLGTNDTKPQNWQYHAEFRQDFIDMIKTFRSDMPENGQVYICLPAPIAENNFGIREKIAVEEMRPILLEVAKETGSKIIDLYSPLAEKRALLPDGVHPNKEGLGIMASEVAKAIK